MFTPTTFAVDVSSISGSVRGVLHVVSSPVCSLDDANMEQVL